MLDIIMIAFGLGLIIIFLIRYYLHLKKINEEYKRFLQGNPRPRKEDITNIELYSKVSELLECRNEFIIGVVIGMVAIMIGIELYTTNQLVGAIEKLENLLRAITVNP